mmetsp:Transcript_49497/g.99280  ORF Transcript_49497/g.99280 Transcript_49497/m.99280 type:complete len:314 (-) Transcript_49497:461-1402(-)
MHCVQNAGGGQHRGSGGCMRVRVQGVQVRCVHGPCRLHPRRRRRQEVGGLGCAGRSLRHAAELEAALWGVHVGAVLEAAGLLVGHGLLLLVGAEVGLEDLDRHVVDLVVLVPLQLLDAVDAPAHLHHRHKWVRALLVQVALPALEDVLDALERHAHDAHVGLVKEVDERRDTALVDQVLDLHVVAARCRVRDRPRALLADVKVLAVEHAHERGDDVVVDHGLELVLAPCGDVGDGPARLLADALALVRQQRQQARQHRAVDDQLRLVVVASHDVADCAQRGRLDLWRDVHEQLHQPPADTRVDHGLDLLVGPV